MEGVQPGQDEIEPEKNLRLAGAGSIPIESQPRHELLDIVGVIFESFDREKPRPNRMVASRNPISAFRRPACAACTAIAIVKLLQSKMAVFGPP